MALLTVGMLIGQLNRTDLAVLMPAMAGDFGWAEANQGLLLSSFYWTYSLFLLPAGLIADRYGPRAPLLLGFVVWSLGSTACGLAGSLAMLAVCRSLIGAGEAALTPSAMRFIRGAFAEERRGAAIGVYTMATKLGPALSFPLTAYLLAGFGWRKTFFIAGLGGLAVLLPLWLVVFRDSEGEAAAAGTAGESGDSSWRGVVPLLGGGALWGILIGTFCYFYFVGFCQTWMPAYLSREHGMSLEASSWYSGFAFGGMAAVAVFAGWAADALIRRGHDALTVRKAFTIAGLVIAASQTLAVWTGSPSLMVFLAVFSLAGLGLAMPNYWAITQTLMPAENIAAVTGLQNSAGHLATIAAPWVTGLLVEQDGAFDAAVRATGLWLLAGLGSYLFLVRRSLVRRARLTGPQPASCIVGRWRTRAWSKQRSSRPPTKGHPDRGTWTRSRRGRSGVLISRSSVTRRTVWTRPPRIVLKTDLFEEANGDDQLLFDLDLGQRVAAGFDLCAATASGGAPPVAVPFPAVLRGRRACFAVGLRHRRLDHLHLDPRSHGRFRGPGAGAGRALSRLAPGGADGVDARQSLEPRLSAAARLVRAARSAVHPGLHAQPPHARRDAAPYGFRALDLETDRAQPAAGLHGVFPAGASAPRPRSRSLDRALVGSV